MFRKSLIISILILTAVILWFLNFNSPDVLLHRGFNSVLTILISYIILKVILQDIAVIRIKDPKTRYSLKKTISVLFVLITAFIISWIWIEDVRTLLVSYGILAAVAAFALQDIFKNFAGGLTIILSKIYTIGDRIEISGKCGDVIDIGILYTSLLEIKEWVPADQTTGRIILVPNGVVLNTDIKNYTKDHDFIWDEIMIPLTYGSDWQEAKRIIMKIVKKETKQTMIKSEKGLTRLQKRYFFAGRDIQPKIYTVLTDNWVTLNIRYVVETKKRRETHNVISEKILKKFETATNITIASSTSAIDITSFPEIKIKKY